MRRFSDEMDRLLEDFGLRLPGFVGRGRELIRREAGLIPADWSPRVEVRERDGRFLVRADLPGLSKDDVRVEVGEDRITIRGRAEAGEDGGGRGLLLQRVQLRQLLPRHPAARGGRRLAGDGGVPQRRARGRPALAAAAGVAGPPPGGPGEEVGRPPTAAGAGVPRSRDAAAMSEVSAQPPWKEMSR